MTLIFGQSMIHNLVTQGVKAQERYRLAADGMKALAGFLSVIAVELLQLTYLHRTQPTAPAIEVLNLLELQVLKAKSPKLPKVLTVSWALEAIARLGGTLRYALNAVAEVAPIWLKSLAPAEWYDRYSKQTP